MRKFSRDQLIKYSLIGIIVVIIIVLAFTVGRIIITPPDDTQGNSDNFDYFPQSSDSDTGNDSQIGRRIINTIGDLLGASNDQPRLSADNLFSVSDQAVSGFNYLDDNTVYYIERSTGHLYTNLPDKNNKKRLSNTASPGMYKIWWNTTNNPLFITEKISERLVTRFFSATLSEKEAQSDGLSFVPVSESIYNPTSLGNKIFYFTENIAGDYSLVENSFDFSSPQFILEDTPLKEFVITPTEKGVYLATKPGYYSSGVLFFVKDNKLEKVLNGQNGFSVLLDKKGDIAIISEYQKNSFVSYLYNIETKEKVNLTNGYLTEKCVPSEKSTIFYCAGLINQSQPNYPDIWFKGLISHNDNIWKIDTTNGTETQITFWDNENGIDVYRPKLTTDEKYLLFQNKKDLSLWSLDLNPTF